MLSVDHLPQVSNTVEYLGQLLESRAFIDNTYDTSWLDTVLSEEAAAEGRSDPTLMYLSSSWQPSSQANNLALALHLSLTRQDPLIFSHPPSTPLIHHLPLYLPTLCMYLPTLCTGCGVVCGSVARLQGTLQHHCLPRGGTLPYLT